MPLIAAGQYLRPLRIRSAFVSAQRELVTPYSLSLKSEMAFSAFGRSESDALQCANAARTVVGVDLGGTRIKAGVVESGQLLRSLSVPTRGTVSAVLAAIADLVRSLAPRPRAVGLAIPGEVDARGRCKRLASIPGFEGIAIARELAIELGCPVTVENDATAATLAEKLHGHGRSFESFLLLTLGTGVGGGIVLGGRLQRGAHGFAGEIGHLAIDFSADAWSCGCGLRGCLEAYAGTRGLLRRLRALGGNANELCEVAGSARAGDRAALDTFESLGRSLGRALSAAQSLLDLDAIVFAGGVAGAFEWFAPSLRRTLAERSHTSELAELPLLVSRLGEHTGVIGAAELVAPTL